MTILQIITVVDTKIVSLFFYPFCNTWTISCSSFIWFRGLKDKRNNNSYKKFTDSSVKVSKDLRSKFVKVENYREPFGNFFVHPFFILSFTS